MDRLSEWKPTPANVLGLGGVLLATALLTSCGLAPRPVPVVGPGVSGNDVPSLTILEPSVDITRGRGDLLLIRWTDSDADDNASISFTLVNTTTNQQVLLIEGLEENDTTGPDTVTISTALVPEGSYNLLGVIDDGINDPVSTFATTTEAGASPRRVVVRIVGEGEGGVRTQPPRVAVLSPEFNQSVSQDDTLTVIVQPSLLAPDASRPYDPDSDITLYIVLDFDLNPNNDDPANPGSNIIRLRTQSVQEDAFEPIRFDIAIDLNQVPPRPAGDPYFIRATVDDSTNPRVHQYAVGTINVVSLASGLVDLFDIGRVSSGARFYGFNPGANLGSEITSISDFDDDGVDDFLMVAQFGNSRNNGPVGEAYAVYGADGVRFGGSVAANTISQTISGVVFEAPPVRSLAVPSSNPFTDGITSASFIPDLSGDGRPDLLFGLRHVHGAIESMDYDPADENIADVTLDVEVVFTQGQVTVQEGDDTAVISNPFYVGIDDTTLDSAQPNTNLGSAATLAWRDNGVGQRKWGLIKFRDVLDNLPDELETIDITTVDATIEVEIANTGGNGDVRECFTDFTEATTFSTFAQNGGEPEATADFDEENIGNVTATEFGNVTVDVSEMVQRLLVQQLTIANNELRFIILPLAGAEAEDETQIRSSEAAIAAQRPLLRIAYERVNLGGNTGCYPDLLVNNRTTAGADRDNYFTAGGIAVIVNSENRDNDPRIGGATRLEATSVTLELVGQSDDVILGASGIDDNGAIFARADDTSEDGRIAGARFMAGPFDWIDAFRLGQEPRNGLFGDKIASIGDLNNDEFPEIVISAPRNELHIQELFDEFGFQSTHWANSAYRGSITVFPGDNYNDTFWREKMSGSTAATSFPLLDNAGRGDGNPGTCTPPAVQREAWSPVDIFEVFAEDVTDMLGQASSAGDFNQDGIDDLLCGAFLNDRSDRDDTGAVYILYGRTIVGNFDLKNADDPILRSPMLRIRGARTGDRIGSVQTSGLDVNGDRIDDVFFGAPNADFGGITRSTCGRDFNLDGVFDNDDLSLTSFNNCVAGFGADVFTTDTCKVFDYDNDGDIDADDRCIFCCLSPSCTPDAGCTLGLNENACCENLVDNGFVGIVFGGVFTDGDRDITQIGTTDLPGTRFYGAATGHRAGHDVSSAGDFNRDGFGDLLIVTPGEIRLDSAGRERVGVVHLVFGGPHLENTEWNLSEVGSAELPGIVFLSPYVRGRPNEAPPLKAALIGDINADGFADIAIGNPKADFIDLSFPQGPDAPGGDASVGRRRNAGDVYIVYGNNFGSNRAVPGG